MSTRNKPRSTGIVKPLLLALVLSLGLSPTLALSVERDGSALFFSFEELKEGFRFSAPLLPSLGDAWHLRPDRADQESRAEKRYRWGNGLGFDSYAYPGTRRPLWGY